MLTRLENISYYHLPLDITCHPSWDWSNTNSCKLLQLLVVVSALYGPVLLGAGTTSFHLSDPTKRHIGNTDTVLSSRHAQLQSSDMASPQVIQVFAPSSVKQPITCPSFLHCWVSACPGLPLASLVELFSCDWVRICALNVIIKPEITFIYYPVFHFGFSYIETS